LERIYVPSQPGRGERGKSRLPLQINTLLAKPRHLRPNFDAALSVRIAKSRQIVRRAGRKAVERGQEKDLADNVKIEPMR
jgi:hypothetical protein